MNFATVIAGLALLTQVNLYRADHQLPALSWSPGTCILAMQRLTDMQSEWSHKGFFKRLGSEDFDGGWWGENLARYGYTPQQTLSEWVDSPLHKANLLAAVPEGCIATDGYYSVLELHKPDV